MDGAAIKSLSELTDHSISFASYNVYMDGWHRPATLNAMEDLNVDVLCLQETNPQWEQAIRGHEGLVQQYPFIKFEHDFHKWGGRAVLSKLPIESWKVLPKVFAWWYFGLKFTVTHPTIGRIAFLNLHLKAAFPANPLKVEGERLQEVKAHMENAKGDNDTATVIVGDFNTRNGPAVRYIKNESGFSAVRDETDVGRSPSWHGFSFLTAAFDHVFYKGFDSVQNANISRTGESDHWPFVVTLIKTSSFTLPPTGPKKPEKN
eukprot:CAMPEP_0113950452 /NCGR_PEP_ID=MMETSP1339-20121228/80892_1 /TAXON_ID=94617 /ORGANISM="Fibrocapsa japonica" /LENGTH=260 /DNA_ID=CAMNT_0000958297 /DNA_START=83 /DNA_END=865 /DNA_ORIENTATION=- /assembly_acc=CAM_ASM_000762